MGNNTNTEWELVGDVNPVQHGGTFIKPDLEVSSNSYYVIAVQPMDCRDEPCYQVIESYVDLDSSDWVEWDKVYETYGLSQQAEVSDIDKILSATTYYSYLEFNGRVKYFNTEEETEAYLDTFGIYVE